MAIHVEKRPIPLTGTVEIYHKRAAKYDTISGELMHEQTGFTKEKDVRDLKCAFPISPACNDRAKVYLDIFVEKGDVMADAEDPETPIGIKRMHVCKRHARDRFVAQVKASVRISINGVPK